MKHEGGCHCGNITVELETAIDPAEIEVRACQCDFCRKHNTRALADPEGTLTFSVADAARLNRYTFGLKTAEYLVCRECGVYVGASTLGPGEPRAIVMANALDNHRDFTREAMPVTYDSENTADRTERRAARWTPARIVI